MCHEIGFGRSTVKIANGNTLRACITMPMRVHGTQLILWETNRTLAFFHERQKKRGCGAGHKVHNLLWWRRPKRLLFELASRKSRTLRVGQKFVFFLGPRSVSLWKHTSTTHELGFDPYIAGGGTSLAAQKTGATSQTLDTSLPPRRKHVQSIQSCFLYVRSSLQKTSCTSWCYTYLDMVKCLCLLDLIFQSDTPNYTIQNWPRVWFWDNVTLSAHSTHAPTCGIFTQPAGVNTVHSTSSSTPCTDVVDLICASMLGCGLGIAMYCPIPDGQTIRNQHEQ